MSAHRQKQLEDKLALLNKQFDAVSTQYNATVNAGDKVPLELQLSDLGKEIESTESELNSLKSLALMDEAKRMERNKAYVEALAQWQAIQTLTPQEPQAFQAIQRLLEKIEQIQRVKNLKKGLSKRKLEIKSIYFKVASHLKSMEKSDIDDEAEITLDTVEEFLNGESSAQDFIELWSAGFETEATKKIDAPNYEALAGRLQRGEIVIFVGSDVPTQIDNNLPSSDNIVPQLTHYIDCEEFEGSFPEVCEYIHINNQFGRGSLRHKLQELITPTLSQTISLYQLIATIQIPLLLISANYDDRLEKAFEKNNKKFVVIGHSADNISILLVKYSDKTEIKQCAIDEFSGLQLLEQGYAVIYKILGCFCFDKRSAVTDSLIISERDFLHFVQQADKLIPDYIVTQLRGRGFWLLGHLPKSWEKRLIIREILNKRVHEEQALTVHENPDAFSCLYWEYRRVKNYAINLKLFVENLQRCLLETS